MVTPLLSVSPLWQRCYIVMASGAGIVTRPLCGRRCSETGHVHPVLQQCAPGDGLRPLVSQRLVVPTNETD